jgi:hypothetical protein
MASGRLSRPPARAAVASLGARFTELFSAPIGMATDLAYLLRSYEYPVLSVICPYPLRGEQGARARMAADRADGRARQAGRAGDPDQETSPSSHWFLLRGLGSGCDRVTREGRERIDFYWSLGGTHTVRVAGSLGGTHTVKVDSYELAFPLASRPVPPSGRRGANGNGYGSILGVRAAGGIHRAVQ